jgi:hypothetical protein
MSEFQFYVYSLLMRITYAVSNDFEDQNSDDLLDLMIEILFLIMIICSVCGALLSILTTGMIPFETASITIFVMIMTLIYLSTM